MVLKSATVLEADVVVAGIGNIIALETVLFINTDKQPRRTFVYGPLQGFFFFFFLPLFNQMLKLNALSGSHISVCAGESSFAGLFGYLHSDLSTHPYFWLKQSNNHIF